MSGVIEPGGPSPAVPTPDPRSGPSPAVALPDPRSGAAPWPTVLLLSGPNLDILGTRQPDIYGALTLADHVAAAGTVARARGLVLEHLQSNAESTLVEAVHAAGSRVAAIVVNAGALTHYSWSLADALAAFDGVVVELHLSNPSSRESWRHVSVVAPVADGSISGFGAAGYELAIEAVAKLLELR